MKKGKLLPCFLRTLSRLKKRNALFILQHCLATMTNTIATRMKISWKSLNQEIKSLLEGLFAFVSEYNAENKEEYVATLKGGAGEFVTLISKFEALKPNTATDSTTEVK